MDHWAALRLALDLHYVPWRVRVVRAQPLPEGLPRLLRVAAGDPETVSAAGQATGRTPEVVREAAGFFIEQILLSAGADSYRVLGAGPGAAGSDLRQNMALLMKWLHPDIARQGDPSIYAARIAAAWNDLKTPERRAAYDSQRNPPTAPGEREPPARFRRARRSTAAGVRHKSRLPRALAFFLLGKRRP
ncbi:MAG TPA: J domain-containing protein [Hyphomicrobiaceae bacterium]|jgi:hypothetical protein